jgi:hypothetical protein
MTNVTFTSSRPDGAMLCRCQMISDAAVVVYTENDQGSADSRLYIMTLYGLPRSLYFADAQNYKYSIIGLLTCDYMECM